MPERRGYNVLFPDDKIKLEVWLTSYIASDLSTIINRSTDKPFTPTELAMLASNDDDFDMKITEGNIRGALGRIKDQRFVAQASQSLAVIAQPAAEERGRPDRYSMVSLQELTDVVMVDRALLQKLLEEQMQVRSFLDYFAPDWRAHLK